MSRTSAPPSPHAYVSDVLLLFCTVTSLTFRAWRQSADPNAPPNPGSTDRDVDIVPRVRSGYVNPLDNQRRRRANASRDAVWDVLDAEAAESAASSSLRESSEDDDDAVSVGSEAAIGASAVSDPLRILAERLTLEEKLSTAVNWLSLVSNCLTYFLRPSQVLYTFLFTNGDFVLFVTSYSNRYQHLHSPPPAVRSRRPRPSHETTPSPSMIHVRTPHEPSHVDGEEATRQNSSTHDVGPGRWPRPASRPDTTSAAAGEHTRSGEGQRPTTPQSGPAVAVLPPASRSPFPMPATHSGPRHRDAATHRSLQKTSGVLSEMTSAASPSPARTCRLMSAMGQLCARLRHAARRCVALAQTQLSWLLVLNALLTSTLFVFHIHHLFFSLGALFGYIAAVASLVLCGMELGCIAVRLRRRHRWCCCCCPVRRSGTAAGGGSREMNAATIGSPVADAYADFEGPAWAFLGEHLSASACSALYIWMLVDEGDVLWSTHVDVMRWYVCSCALMALSLLKCLRVVF